MTLVTTCQSRKPIGQQTWEAVAQALPHRSIPDAQARFEYLNKHFMEKRMTPRKKTPQKAPDQSPSIQHNVSGQSRVQSSGKTSPAQAEVIHSSPTTSSPDSKDPNSWSR